MFLWYDLAIGFAILGRPWLSKRQSLPKCLQLEDLP